MRLTLERLEKLVGKISFRDYQFLVMGKGDGFLLQIQFVARDNFRPNRVEIQRCRKWYISSNSCRGEVIRTAWKAVEAAVLHEAQEQFLYKGRAIYDPHLDPDAVAEVKKRSVRNNPTRPWT